MTFDVYLKSGKVVSITDVSFINIRNDERRISFFSFNEGYPTFAISEIKEIRYNEQKEE